MTRQTTYVALLRGINVGGKNKVEMARLKACLEITGLNHVSTYINSGNVIFTSDQSTIRLLVSIEQAIEQTFGFSVRIVLRDLSQIKRVVNAAPTSWVNDQEMKCDVMFLWEDIDSPSIIEQIPWDPTIEDLTYVPGALLWRIDRASASKSKVLKIIGTSIYKQMTIRNCNTVRKLYQLMVTCASS